MSMSNQIWKKPRVGVPKAGISPRTKDIHEGNLKLIRWLESLKSGGFKLKQSLKIGARIGILLSEGYEVENIAKIVGVSKKEVEEVKESVEHYQKKKPKK